MPKISVIIPVYNVEEYLIQCLDSIINQTLKDIEIICIDDKSTDSSLEILKAYAAQDNRIKIIEQQKNQGQGIARNLGINLAQGEYIGFVDPDDYIENRMYELMYNQAKELNSDIVICDALRYETWRNKSYKINYFIKAISKTQTEKIDVQEHKNLNKKMVLSTLLIAPCHAWNKIYKKELLESVPVKFEIDRIFEDVMFITKAFTNAKNISYINHPYYIYNVNKNSSTRQPELKMQIFNTIDKVKKWLIENNLYETLKLNFDYFTIMNTVWTWWILAPYSRKKFYKLIKEKIDKENFREIKKYLNLQKREKIFSISEENKHKVFKICGVKLKFKKYEKNVKTELNYLKKITRNQKKYKKNSYIFFDCLHDTSVENIDAYSLFEYMKKGNNNCFYVILKDSQLYKKLERENNLENIIVLENTSRERPDEFIKAIYKPLLKAKAVITSFGENTVETEEFFRTNKSFKYIFIQHGAVFLKESIFDKHYLYPEKFDYILISSEKEYQIFKKNGWRDNQLIKCGLPRWDLLPKNKTETKSILIMFTWRNMSNLNFIHSLYKKNILKLLNNSEFIESCISKNIKLYFAPHHALKSNQDIDFKVNNENIEIIDTTKISEYIRKCSCLITDFSSVAFDFMFQNKPVLFYLMDKGDTNLKSYEYRDIERFNYKKYILPNVFYNKNDVIEKLHYYIEHNFESEPETIEKYNKFFYTKDHIREQLTNKIEEICKD